MYPKEIIKGFLDQADIRINGNRDSDIRIHDKRIYRRVLAQGNLGLGESYMDGWWDSKRIDKMIYNILSSEIHNKFKINRRMILVYLKSRLANLQRLRAYNIGERHYDIGNDLYRLMLDKNMQYSCGYWKDARNLKSAQIAKMDLICKKLKLKKGETLLDIGCGWGGLLRYAAKNYGIRGIGLTVSKEQARYANENSKNLPVEFKITDYRKYRVKFDKIVSVGMFEHVGPKNYETYMATCRNNLKDGGLFLLHTIGSHKAGKQGDPWIDKYIFPDGVLPSLKQITQACEGKFNIEDVHEFGLYYDKTLMAWNANFQKGWSKLKGYDNRFKRMWEYYLLSCAAGFRARYILLWQIVLSKNLKNIYQSHR